MYENFDFNDITKVHEEIVKISNTEDENEAIVKAFHFQRYYAKAVKRANAFTGYQAITTTLSNIRQWIGNEDSETASRIDYLWGNIPA